MAIIEMEIWKKNPERPGTVIFDQLRPAQEIFDELKAHLKADGRMPDEYFLFSFDRGGEGKLFPKDADIVCNTNYGGSEGVYIDISVRYEKDVHEFNKAAGISECKKRMVNEPFATGKTLGDTIEDLDKMHLVASSVMAAFYGMESEVRERYSKIESGEIKPLYPHPTSIVIKATPPPIQNNMGLVAKNHPQRDNPQFMELARRLDKNFSDYQNSLDGFGATEITDNAGRIKAMSDAHSYMVFYHNFSDYELDFYLKFRTPLEIVGDVLTERNRDVGNVSDILDYIKGQQDDYLGDYPLMEGVK